MLRVLQHYLPIRTALLVFSESILFLLVLSAGVTQHLWAAAMGRRDPDHAEVLRELANVGMTVDDGLVRCILSALLSQT